MHGSLIDGTRYLKTTTFCLIAHPCTSRYRSPLLWVLQLRLLTLLWSRWPWLDSMLHCCCCCSLHSSADTSSFFMWHMLTNITAAQSLNHFFGIFGRNGMVFVEFWPKFLDLWKLYFFLKVGTLCQSTRKHCKCESFYDRCLVLVTIGTERPSP